MRQRPFLVEGLTLLALIATPFVLPHLGFTSTTINRILIWGLFGIGFDILFGFGGLLSFGQSAFFGAGGMIMAYLLTVMNFPNVTAAVFIGTIVAGIIGYLVGLLALRRTGIYFAMITVAIAQVFYFVEFNPLSRFTGGENGLPGVPSPSLWLGFTTINFQNDFLVVLVPRGLVFHRHGDCVAHHPLAGRRHPERNSRKSLTRRRRRPQHSWLQALRICYCRGICRICRRLTRLDAGLHAARCVHVRHVGPTRDANRNRRNRDARRAACSARRCGSISATFSRRRCIWVRPGSSCSASSSCCWSGSYATASPARWSHLWRLASARSKPHEVATPDPTPVADVPVVQFMPAATASVTGQQ